MSKYRQPIDDLWWWLLRTEGVTAGFTWRGAGDAMNLTLPRDLRARPTDPWLRLATAVGARAIVQGEQVHGGQPGAVTGGPLGDWLVLPQCDAVICTVPGVAVAVRVADCLPVLLWVPSRVVAVVHAGWRGLVADIVPRTLSQLERMSFPAGQLSAAFGPRIGLCCFEIGEDVAAKLGALVGGEQHVTRRGHRWFADLAGLVKEQLIVGGVRPEALVDTGGCTQEDTEYFFSYRRDGGDAGRQVGIAVIPAGAPRGMSAGRAPGRVLVNAHQQTTGPSYDYPG
ncbi:MAG: polyphenol oxidase family protein [Armatimonadota bacterium]